MYGAFLLDRHKEARQSEARRSAIYEALLAEVKLTEESTRWYQAYLDSNYVRPIVQPYEQGEQPPIYGLWLPTGRQSGAWGAMLEAGVDLLDPQFIQTVEWHRSTVQFMLDQSERAMRLSDERIEPLLGSDAFYESSGRLQPQHRWYPRLLGYLHGNADYVLASADSLRTEIEYRLGTR